MTRLPPTSSTDVSTAVCRVCIRLGSAALLLEPGSCGQPIAPIRSFDQEPLPVIGVQGERLPFAAAGLQVNFRMWFDHNVPPGGYRKRKNTNSCVQPAIHTVRGMDRSAVHTAVRLSSGSATGGPRLQGPTLFEARLSLARDRQDRLRLPGSQAARPLTEG